MALRDIQRADLAMILEWRNHPMVRYSMRSSELISHEEHLRWFERTITSESSVYLIFEDDAEPQGVVYLKDWDPELKTGEWGFYKSPEAKKGLGRIMCEEALGYFFCELGAREIKAEVLKNNTRSLDLHLWLGFVADERPRELAADKERCVEIWNLNQSVSQWEGREK